MLAPDNITQPRQKGPLPGEGLPRDERAFSDTDATKAVCQELPKGKRRKRWDRPLRDCTAHSQQLMRDKSATDLGDVFIRCTSACSTSRRIDQVCCSCCSCCSCCATVAALAQPITRSFKEVDKYRVGTVNVRVHTMVFFETDVSTRDSSDMKYMLPS